MYTGWMTLLGWLGKALCGVATVVTIHALAGDGFLASVLVIFVLFGLAVIRALRAHNEEISQ